MILRYIKGILLLIALSLSTAFTAQPSNDTNFVCLEAKKVDFLVEWYLRAQSLMVDTNIMAMENRGCDAIIEQKDNQISDLGDVIILKDTIANKQRVSYLDLYDKYSKKEKKLKLFKNTTTIFGSISIILFAILVFIVK